MVLTSEMAVVAAVTAVAGGRPPENPALLVFLGAEGAENILFFRRKSLTGRGLQKLGELGTNAFLRKDVDFFSLTAGTPSSLPTIVLELLYSLLGTIECA